MPDDPVYFPQINSNLILTQLPYTAGLAYETVTQDMETGMRWTFPRRGIGIDGYPANPLGKFGINFQSITDAEIDTLQAFFRSMRGRWGTFRFVDPGGNLVQFSGDLEDDYWDNSGSIGAHVLDPSGQGLLGRNVGAGIMKGQVTPDDGGLAGFIFCASVWVNVRDAGRNLFIGIENDGAVTRGTLYKNLPLGVWIRISHREVLWDSGKFFFVLGGHSSTVSQTYVFGPQVTPTKGECAYVVTPGNYGYHQNCRFDTDVFERRMIGPNQNAVSLPIVEFNVAVEE